MVDSDYEDDDYEDTSGVKNRLRKDARREKRKRNAPSVGRKHFDDFDDDNRRNRKQRFVRNEEY